MAFKKREAKGKKFNPATIFMVLAVMSYAVGFPLPVTAFLAFVAYILFKAKKDGKSLKDLPMPPSSDEQTEANQNRSLSTDFGRQPDQRSPFDMFEQDDDEALSQRSATTGAEQQPWMPVQPKPAPEFETTAPTVTRTTTTRARPSPYRIDDGQSDGRLVRQFRSVQGLRQAVAAMTVLGPPRAIEPYVSDPMRSATLGLRKRKG